MEALRQYVLSVSCAAILCGLVISMIPKGTIQGIVKLVCGVFLAILVVQPVTQLNPERILFWFRGYAKTDGDAAAAFGEEIARDSMSAYIKEKAEAYILDKAHGFGIEAEVEVTVGKDDLPVPVAAVIRGNVPDALRRKLEQQITDNLGIAKENLEWIGQS